VLPIRSEIKLVVGASLVLSGFGMGYVSSDYLGPESSVDVSVPEEKIQVDAGPDTVSVRAQNNEWIPANRLEVNYSRVSGGVEVQEVDYLAEVNGGSMRPAFWEGNTVLLKEYSEGISLQSGNVVLTENGVLHTVVHNYLDSGGSVKIKGYNSESRDSVSESKIDSVVLGVLYTKQDKSGGVDAYAKAK